MGVKNLETTVEVIREADLKAYLKLRAMAKRANSLAEELKKKAAGQEADLIAKLKAGAVVTGGLSASVDNVPGQCRPSWKDEYLAHMLTDHQLSNETAEAQLREKTGTPKVDKLVIAERS